VKPETETEKASKDRKRQIAALLKKANEGDTTACQEVYARLEEAGTVAEFVESQTDSAFLTRLLGHSSPVRREAYRRRMDALRQELGDKTASPLERLLIERIVLCWYHLNQSELNYVSSMKDGVPLPKALFLEKALDRAESRYQTAVRSLAILRRLQIPPVQVNVAEKQVNLLQSGVQQNLPLPSAAPAALPEALETKTT
jgi:hypothetical protein